MSDVKSITLFTGVIVLFWVVSNAIVQVLLKKGVSDLNVINSLSDIFDLNILMTVVKNSYISIGIVLYIISFFLWIYALTKLDVSVLSPIGSLIFVIVAILAVFFLGEKVTSIRWMGIILVVAGSILIART